MLAVCPWIWGCQSGKLPQSRRKEQMNFRSLPVYTMRIKFKCGNPIQTLCSDSFCASRNWKSTKDRENDWNSFINLRDDLTAWLTSLTSTSCMSLLSQRMQASLSSCLNLARFCSSWGGHHDITFEYFWTACICAKCDDDIIAFKGKKQTVYWRTSGQIFKRNPGSVVLLSSFPSGVLPESNAQVRGNLAFATIHSWDVSLKDVPSPWRPWIRNESTED